MIYIYANENNINQSKENNNIIDPLNENNNYILNAPEFIYKYNYKNQLVYAFNDILIGILSYNYEIIYKGKIIDYFKKNYPNNFILQVDNYHLFYFKPFGVVALYEVNNITTGYYYNFKINDNYSIVNSELIDK